MATKNLTLDTFERTVNGDGIIVYTQPGVLAPLQLDQHIVRKDPLMCSRITCSACGKPTWTGCGQHVEDALYGVPEADRCSCN